MKEGTFAEYTSFLKGSLRKIKKVYDRALINNAIGTLTPSTSACDITITTPKGSTIEETNRLEAQTVAKEIVVIKADLEDNNRLSFTRFVSIKFKQISCFFVVQPIFR